VCVCVFVVSLGPCLIWQVFSSPTAYAWHAEHSEPRSFDVIDYNTSHDHPCITHKGVFLLVFGAIFFPQRIQIDTQPLESRGD